MLKVNFVCVVTLFSSSLIGCAVEKPAGTVERKTDRESGPRAQRAIRGILKGQTRQWNRGDLDGFAKVYAADALLLTSEDALKGQPDIKEYLKNIRDKHYTKLEIWPVEFSVTTHPNVAAVAIRWRRSGPDDDTGIKPLVGKSLLVFERRGRQWRIIQEATL